MFYLERYQTISHVGAQHIFKYMNKLEEGDFFDNER